MLSIFLLIPLSLMLFVVAIWAVRYAVRSNQFEDLDNASQRIILDDRQERRQVIQAHESAKEASQKETLQKQILQTDELSLNDGDNDSLAETTKQEQEAATFDSDNKTNQ
ncbi:cbb3-type cytochrome oxidase assembly protein CcoS [Psychrobacter jeotgali]|uniref:cbb3-type cytochrome oxidase assembly protein CcoS n=1 Tax=Psychrobacter jeotgali TaxID=179010 RepID=UPI001D12FDE0|nr:cbb3-type cytochrome oxidase assembly protein CcoS [Psychrobacter jeotgali]